MAEKNIRTKVFFYDQYNEGDFVNQVKDILMVRIKRDTGGMSDPTSRRRNGFLNYINSHFPDVAVHNLFIDPSDSESTDKSLSEYLSAHPGTKLVVMFNSRVHLLAKSLSAHPSEDRRVIGFDDLPQNISLLRDGLADVLVSHHVEKECARGVEILSDFILTRKLPAVKDNYAHIDILTRYNLENF